jgi:DNA-binding NarL/FixJ family response regulator
MLMHHTPVRLRRETGNADGPGVTDTQVLVVDERAAVRSGVRAVLTGERSLRVGTTDTSGAALKLTMSGRADLCVLDYNLARGGTGLFLACRLKQLPSPPGVVLYAEHVDGFLAGAAKLAGADALISQHASGDELAQVLRLVARGKRCFTCIPPSAMYRLCEHLHPADRPIVTMAAHDTKREHIAEVMGISEEWLATRTLAILEQLQSQLASPTPAAALAASA